MTSSNLVFRQVAGRIGVELSGITLSGDLDEVTIAAIRQAVLTHKIVFVRAQHLDQGTQEEFSALLGRPVGHPTLSHGVDYEYMASLTSKSGPRTNNWHSDITFVADYPAFTILTTTVVPPYGGDTLWANTVSAYQSLPATLQNIADQLRVTHTNEYPYELRHLDPESEEAYRRFRTEIFASTEFETEHPLVRVHPETGERSLVLGAFGAKGFVGLDHPDSTALFELFQRHITRIEETVRWHWGVGDIAIWDNRATQHYASHDYRDLGRRIQRTTVAGEWPVSVDGRKSVVVKGAEHPWYAQRETVGAVA